MKFRQWYIQTGRKYASVFDTVYAFAIPGKSMVKIPSTQDDLLTSIYKSWNYFGQERNFK